VSAHAASGALNMNVEAGTRARRRNREHPSGEGSSANLFDDLAGQAKPASEGDVRTSILTHRERTSQGPTDLFRF
jgi:hypothetical protein